MADIPQLVISLRGRQWQVDVTRAHDISIPLAFDEPQPNFFGAPPASSRPLTAGTFIGDVREGGSCNCSTYTLTPHCNGTHTESVGHVTRDRIAVSGIPIPAFSLARLVTVAPIDAALTNETTEPTPQPNDKMITRASLQDAVDQAIAQNDDENDDENDDREDSSDITALIVRTTPNSVSKRQRSYGPAHPAPYFSAEAMRWIVARGIQQLIVDLPSLDRAEDEGRLTAHRIFWGLPPGSTAATDATRAHATVTELAYIEDSIVDGVYLVNLQTAPFAADAAPSRPLLMPLRRL